MFWWSERRRLECGCLTRQPFLDDLFSFLTETFDLAARKRKPKSSMRHHLYLFTRTRRCEHQYSFITGLSSLEKMDITLLRHTDFTHEISAIAYMPFLRQHDLQTFDSRIPRISRTSLPHFLPFECAFDVGNLLLAFLHFDLLVLPEDDSSSSRWR